MTTKNEERMEVGMTTPDNREVTISGHPDDVQWIERLLQCVAYGTEPEEIQVLTRRVVLEKSLPDVSRWKILASIARNATGRFDDDGNMLVARGIAKYPIDKGRVTIIWKALEMAFQAGKKIAALKSISDAEQVRESAELVIRLNLDQEKANEA